MSSLLQSFYFLFESDSKKLDDGLRDSENKSKGLEKVLMSTDQVADKLGGSFLDLARNAGTALAGMLAWSAIKSLSVESAAATTELANMSKGTKLAVDDFHALKGVVEANGGDIGGLSAKLQELAPRMKDPLKYLGDMADKMKGMSQQQAMDYGAAMGLDQGTITMMMQGRRALEENMAKQKDLGVITADQVETAKKYNEQQTRTNMVWDDMRRTVATAVLPILTKFLGGFETLGRWVRENRTFVIAFFGAIAAAITVFYLPALWGAVVATYALIAPYLLIVGVVAAVGAAFALALDDVMAFLDGNDSVIGDLAKKWPIVGDVVRGLVDSFKFVKDALQAFAMFFVDAFTVGPTQAIENLGARLGAFVDSVAQRFPFVKSAVDIATNAFNTLRDGMAAAADTISGKWEAVTQVVKRVIGFVLDSINKMKGLAGAVADFFGAGGDAEQAASGVAPGPVR